MHCVESPQNGSCLEWQKVGVVPLFPRYSPRGSNITQPFCLERLNHVISEAVENGAWKPIQLSRTGPNLSHIFFADDLILFTEASVDHIKTVMMCLEIFCSMSGQKVSFQKSSIRLSKKIAKEVAEDIGKIAGIPLIKDLGRYLGSTSTAVGLVE